MNKEGGRDTQSDATVQGAPPARPPRSLLYRLQKYGSRKLPSLIPHPNIRKTLQEARQYDEKENSESEPPPDEFVDLRCIWAVEYYTPAHVAQLLRGFEQLGWNTPDSVADWTNPVDWVQRSRETGHGGAWYNLGPIDRPGHKRFLPMARPAPLPIEVDYALAEIYCLTSSITCLVICFILDQEYSRLLDAPLRKKRQTVLERIRAKGYRFVSPAAQKAADIRIVRVNLRRSVTNWFRIYLPGAFSGGLLRGEFPTCELATLRIAQPFPKEEERECQSQEWLRILNMNNDIDAWEVDGVPGLRFARPHSLDNKGEFHAIVAAKEDAFSAEELRFYGNERTSYVHCVNVYLNGLLSRWALLAMLSGFEGRLNKIRDSATFIPTHGRKTFRLLTRLSGHVSGNVDIAAASSELRRFSEQGGFFRYRFRTFKPCNSQIYRDKEITFSEMLRKHVEQRSTWLENVDHSVRDLLIQYGTILGTGENIRLQKRIGCLTWIMTFLTVVITALTALTAYFGVKAGEISWPF